MPKLSEFKHSYYEFSGLASASSRQLAFAGIALIWIFRQNTPGELSLPQNLLYPAALFVLSLTADLFHYFVASLIWGIFHRRKEKQFQKEGIAGDPETDAPIFLNWPNLIFYCLKVGFVIIGYYQLFMFILCTIEFT